MSGMNGAASPRWVVEILWTGGFDSSFRVVQLSRMDVIVQPYYIRDRRRSERNELDAMRTIRALLLARPETKAELHEPILLNSWDILVPDDIRAAERALIARYALKSQYAWMAAFALAHPNIEAGIVKGDNSLRILNENGGTAQYEDAVLGHYFKVSPDAAPEVRLINSGFCFPNLDMTKVDIRNEYLRLKYRDVMDATWSCHHPVRGKPCGVCGPCRTAIAEGMAGRLDAAALRRAKHPIFWRKTISALDKAGDLRLKLFHHAAP